MSQFQKQADEGKVYTAAMLVLQKKRDHYQRVFSGLACYCYYHMFPTMSRNYKRNNLQIY